MVKHCRIFFAYFSSIFSLTQTRHFIRAVESESESAKESESLKNMPTLIPAFFVRKFEVKLNQLHVIFNP